MARPVKWTPELKKKACEVILKEIATSELGLVHICDASKDLPDARTFTGWCNEDSELDLKYVHARELQAQFCTDNAAVIATQLVAKKPTHSIDPQAFRAYLDAVKWRASKLAPKKFGDKVQVEQSGKDGGKIQQDVTIRWADE